MPHKHADVLYTASPVPVSRRLAPVLLVPCPPLMRNPFMVDALTVVNELALIAVATVIVACFVANAAATFVPPIVTADTLRLLLVVKTSCFAASVVAISTPPKYS